MVDKFLYDNFCKKKLYFDVSRVAKHTDLSGFFLHRVHDRPRLGPIHFKKHREFYSLLITVLYFQSNVPGTCNIKIVLQNLARYQGPPE